MSFGPLTRCGIDLDVPEESLLFFECRQGIGKAARRSGRLLCGANDSGRLARQRHEIGHQVGEKPLSQRCDTGIHVAEMPDRYSKYCTLMRETVYTPESPVRQPLKLLAELGRDIAASRELAVRLFLRDFSAQYRQSALGYLWALAPPIIFAFPWIFLDSQQIINPGPTVIPYIAYVLAGTTVWSAFAEGLLVPLNSLVANKVLLTKVNFPREALIIGGLGQLVTNLLLRVLVMLCPGSSWSPVRQRIALACTAWTRRACHCRDVAWPVAGSGRTALRRYRKTSQPAGRVLDDCHACCLRPTAAWARGLACAMEPCKPAGRDRP